MNIELRVDHLLKIRYQIIEGQLNLNDLISYLDKMNDEHKQDFDMNVCWNLENAEISNVDISDIEKLVSKVIKDWKSDNTKKLAIVVSSKLKFGMTRIYQTLLDIENVSTVKIFNDAKEAVEWLTRSELT